MAYQAQYQYPNNNNMHNPQGPLQPPPQMNNTYNYAQPPPPPPAYAYQPNGSQYLQPPGQATIPNDQTPGMSSAELRQRMEAAGVPEDQIAAVIGSKSSRASSMTSEPPHDFNEKTPNNKSEKNGYHASSHDGSTYPFNLKDDEDIVLHMREIDHETRVLLPPEADPESPLYTVKIRKPRYITIDVHHHPAQNARSMTEKPVGNARIHLSAGWTTIESHGISYQTVPGKQEKWKENFDIVPRTDKNKIQKVRWWFWDASMEHYYRMQRQLVEDRETHFVDIIMKNGREGSIYIPKKHIHSQEALDLLVTDSLAAVHKTIYNKQHAPAKSSSSNSGNTAGVIAMNASVSASMC